MKTADKTAVLVNAAKFVWERVEDDYAALGMTGKVERVEAVMEFFPTIADDAENKLWDELDPSERRALLRLYI